MNYGSIPPPLTYRSALKFTIDGRPTVNDIHDLFSSLISQVSFATHKHMFRNYQNTFSSEEAISKLGSLNMFSEATLITLNLEKDMAKALLQQFLWTRLIEYAVDPQNRSYRDKGIWRLRSKGLCVLQEFCIKTNRVDLLARFKECVNTPSIEPMFLIHVERIIENDRMNRKRKYISCLFAIMVASLPFRDDNNNINCNTIMTNSPNSLTTHAYTGGRQYPLHHKSSLSDFGNSNSDLYSTFAEDSLSRKSSRSSSSSNLTSTSSIEANLITDYFPHIKIFANDLLAHVNPIQKSNKTSTFMQQKALLRNLRPSSSNKFKMRAIFTSLLCCDWLVGYCSVASNDEAEIIMTEFLNLGWITFYDEKNRNKQRVESSKSVQLKLTGTGMKVIIDVSSEKYEDYQQQQQQHQQHQQQQQQEQQNQKEDEADKYEYEIEQEEKRHSVAFSSFSNQTESTTFSNSLTFSFEELIVNTAQQQQHQQIQQSPLPSIKHTKAVKNNNSNTPIKKSGSLKKPKPTYEQLPYFGNNPTTTPYILEYANITPPTTPVQEKNNTKESNSIKLKGILKDVNLRSLFREFLEVNLCVENLDFWMDHQKLRSEWHESLDVLAIMSPLKQQTILKDAYILWNTYLSYGAKRELNIDHTLREDMAEEISNMVTVVNTGKNGIHTVPTIIFSMHSAYENLLAILVWFDKVNDQICKLMAADSIPKFIRTVEYKKLAGQLNFQQQPLEIEQPSSIVSLMLNSDDLDYFPPPPQRELKETLFL